MDFRERMSILLNINSSGQVGDAFIGGENPQPGKIWMPFWRNGVSRKIKKA
jgi:hypothetical protein